jgi:DNA-binding LytR/AlgR family response regulator
MSRFTTHILLVEDEMAIAMDVEMRLKRIGYIVDGIAVDAEEAMRMVDEGAPDILLMDIQLGDKMEGINLARKFQSRKIPIVFLTAFSDPGTFAQALDTKPAGYVIKPFRDDDLQRTIEIALQKASEERHQEEDFSAQIQDTFFIREKGELIRLCTDEIRWLEAMDNYTKVNTAAKTYTVKAYLKDILGKLPSSQFVRVHRSFIVHIPKISRIEEATIYIEKQAIPIGKQYKEELMGRLRVL